MVVKRPPGRAHVCTFSRCCLVAREQGQGHDASLTESGAVALSNTDFGSLVSFDLQVVESGAKNIEISLVTKDGVEIMGEEELAAIVKEVEKEKEEADAAAAGGAAAPK